MLKNNFVSFIIISTGGFTMEKKEKDTYLFEKKSLVVFLYLMYVNNISYERINLRSFGFNFDPKCNFKAIIRSKKEHDHKYSIRIFPNQRGVNFDTLDVMGNVNIVKVKDIREFDAFEPEASLNIYFDEVQFYAIGFIEGKAFKYKSKNNRRDVTDNLLYFLINSKEENHINTSSDNFLSYLVKFFTNKLKTDLVMGAGINADYGAKSWPELIQALNTEFYKGKEELANQISSYVGKELFTSSMIMKASGFDSYKSINHELYEFKEAKSFNDPDSTLYRCVDFLEKHPGTEVITYNYDTNLEYLMKKRNLRYVTIYDDSAFNDKEVVTTIYHVHGLLPYDRYNETKFTDSLIFNESEYYYLYNNPYSWNIAKQLHDFKFNTCLFIGISLTDPDMKRLLELARNYLKFNFIFLKKIEGYSEAVYKALTTYFFTFDLIVIWIDEYDEIGDWLKIL